jgi:hypothetical protein
LYSQDRSGFAGLALVAAAVAVARWRPDWLVAATTWYFAEFRAIGAAVLTSSLLRSVAVWYFAECKWFVELLAKNMTHR